MDRIQKCDLMRLETATMDLERMKDKIIKDNPTNMDAMKMCSDIFSAVHHLHCAKAIGNLINEKDEKTKPDWYPI